MLFSWINHQVLSLAPEKRGWGGNLGNTVKRGVHICIYIYVCVCVCEREREKTFVVVVVLFILLHDEFAHV